MLDADLDAYTLADGNGHLSQDFHSFLIHLTREPRFRSIRGARAEQPVAAARVGGDDKLRAHSLQTSALSCRLNVAARSAHLTVPSIATGIQVRSTARYRVPTSLQAARPHSSRGVAQSLVGTLQPSSSTMPREYSWREASLSLPN